MDAFGNSVGRDACQPGCLFSVWTCQESKGVPGLQRGDEVRGDTCHWTISPDTLAFS